MRAGVRRSHPRLVGLLNDRIRRVPELVQVQALALEPLEALRDADGLFLLLRAHGAMGVQETPHLDAAIRVLRDHVHEVVRGIVRRRRLELQRPVKPHGDLGLGPLVHGAAARGEEKKLVQSLPDLTPGLVYHHSHRDPRTLADILEGLDHRQRRGRVQPGRGLVQEQRQRAGHHFHADIHALALAAGDAATRLVSDDGVLHVE
mmetsp:Transcript_10223/g.30494  ORF Transcript_10223/g.30494 Transcript_10223/m.30494 type:complete len:204 (+) Transcript_10223:2797-3408(+)